MPSFSADVYGLVTSYLVCGPAKALPQPNVLLQLLPYGEVEQGPFHHNCFPAMARDGKMWVAGWQDRVLVRLRFVFVCSSLVQVFSEDGAKLLTCTAPPWARTTDIRHVAVDYDGTALLTDESHNKVLIYGPEGRLISQISGGRGSRDREFGRPIATSPDGNGLLFVGDAANSRIMVIRRDGTFVRAVGSEGHGDGQFSRKNNITRGGIAGVCWSAVNKQLAVVELGRIQVRVTSVFRWCFMRVAL